MKKLLAIVLALAMVLSLAACGGNGGSGEKTLTEDGKMSNITTAVSSEIQNLLPTNGNGNPKAQFYWNIYESLFTYNKDLEFAPCLAKSWEAVDGTHWNISLYEKIYDSAGNHITAEDVVFSFEWLVSAGEALNFDIFKGISVVDEYTVQIEWTQTPTSAADIEFPLTRTFIVDSEAFDEVTFATAPVATGNYVVKSFVTGSEMVLEANPDYWALKTDEDVSGRLGVHNATVQTLTYRIIQGSDTAEIELEMGNIDYCDYIKYLSLDKFQNNDEYVVSVEVASDYAFMGYNMDPSSPLSDDLNLRLAIAYALDSDAIAAAMPGSYSGMKTYGTSYFSDFDPAWEEEENYLTVHNTELAKEYLAKSNYAANGSPTLEVICKSAEADKNAVQMILSQLSAVGINVTMKSVDQATFQTDTSDPTNWDLLFFNPMGGKDLASSWKLALANMGNARTDGGTGSIIFHNDQELFDLYDVATADATHTTENMKKVIDHVFANAYVYPVAYSVSARVYRADVISELYLREGYVTLGASTYAGQEVNADPSVEGMTLGGGDVSAIAGTYTFSEVVGEGSGACEYTITLNEDGTYRIDQLNMYGENVWIEGTYSYIGGTVVCAAPAAGVQGAMDRWLNSGWTDVSAPECQWTLNGDGTATPVGYDPAASESEDKGEEEGGEEAELPGIVNHFVNNEGYEMFNFYEKSDSGYITWYLLIKQETEEGDSKTGSYVMVQMVEVDDKTELVYRGTYTQTKGDITTGAPNEDSDTQRVGTVWNEDGTINWSIFGGGTVAHANMEGIEEYKTGVNEGTIPTAPVSEPAILTNLAGAGFDRFDWTEDSPVGALPWHVLIKADAETTAEGLEKGMCIIVVENPNLGTADGLLVYHCSYTKDKGTIMVGCPDETDEEMKRLGGMWNEDGTSTWNIKGKGVIEPTMVG